MEVTGEFRRLGPRLSAFALALLAQLGIAQSSPAEAIGAQRVSFPSADGTTTLVGYLILPSRKPSASPAIVLMHGRSGLYSSNAHGDFSGFTLRKRDETWARLWADRGYVVLMVDSFGPRGFPAGFAAGSHDRRPPQVDEVTVRPLDAYGALAFLRERSDVVPDRIGLEGWSNGASAVLATMADHGAGSADRTGKRGFRVAAAFYPGCGLNGRFASGYRPYAPVKIFIGTLDEEVSLAECQALGAKSATLSDRVELRIYSGATHDFDDPSNHRQDNAANALAKTAATDLVTAFFDRELRPESSH